MALRKYPFGLWNFVALKPWVCQFTLDILGALETEMTYNRSDSELENIKACSFGASYCIHIISTNKNQQLKLFWTYIFANTTNDKVPFVYVESAELKIWKAGLYRLVSIKAGQAQA